MLELVGELLIDLFARALGKLISSPSKATQVGVVLLGIASGVISVHLFPHPLVHPSRLHGISVIVGPVIAGLVMSQIGRFLRSRGKRTVQIESFTYGFAFAFAMAVVRFLSLK